LVVVVVVVVYPLTTLTTQVVTKPFYETLFVPSHDKDVGVVEVLELVEVEHAPASFFYGQVLVVVVVFVVFPLTTLTTQVVTKPFYETLLVPSHYNNVGVVEVLELVEVEHAPASFG
jgi:uncharacterized membrane protein YagU involved in acid resistance